MTKLVYTQPVDYFVKVSVCSLTQCLDEHDFTITVDTVKIETILNRIPNDTRFIVFPEYSYNDDLYQLYRNYSDQNNCIVIGGSGLQENADSSLYAFCPVFIPNTELIKVYKKHITVPETVISGGRLRNYTDDIQRLIVIDLNGFSITFSVYVCYDFIRESKDYRADIVFIPQFELSPDTYISHGDDTVKKHRNFVVGCNNANGRSIGFAIINNSIINGLHIGSYRSPNYIDANQKFLMHHHTVIYDTMEEKIITMNLNLGCPFSLPFNIYNQPVIIPTGIITIP